MPRLTPERAARIDAETRRCEARAAARNAVHNALRAAIAKAEGGAA